MSVAYEVQVSASDAERALDALLKEAWAVEIFGEGVLIALFAHDAEARLHALLPYARRVRALGQRIPAELVAWREPLRALQVGPLWIGNERSAPCPFGQYNLRLITKDAFGSGLHETTLLCLQRILELSPIDRLLDVGSGSGILALTALMLGAKRAAATEIDPLSIAAAEENARVNGLVDRFSIGRELPDETFPLVVANIIAPVLLELAPAIARTVESTLLLSGLRDHDVDRVVDRYRALGLQRGATAMRGSWARVELLR